MDVLDQIAVDEARSWTWGEYAGQVWAHLGGPPVFVSQFVQTHVRVYRNAAGLAVELWSHPRPARQRLLDLEWLAVAGTVSFDSEEGVSPRVQMVVQSPQVSRGSTVG